MSLDLMRMLESFYFWILISVFFFSCLCYCIEPCISKRKRRGDVLNDPKCEPFQDSLFSASVRPDPLLQRTILSNNSILLMPGRQNENTRTPIVSVSAQQTQIPTAPIPYSIINPSVPTDMTQDISQGENFVQLPAQPISNTLHRTTTRLPPTSNHIAEQLLKQRANVETPPPAFETAINLNPSPLSNIIRSAETTPSQNTTIDPPPPYPGPPPGESSL